MDDNRSNGSGGLGVRYALTVIALVTVAAASLSIFAFSGPYAKASETAPLLSTTRSSSATGAWTPGGTSYLLVETQVLHGSLIFGFYVQVFAAGKQVATGFTPVTFPLGTGSRYVVYINPYQNCTFDYWLGTGNFTNGRVVTPSGNDTLTAVMNCGKPSSSTIAASTTTTIKP